MTTVIHLAPNHSTRSTYLLFYGFNLDFNGKPICGDPVRQLKGHFTTCQAAVNFMDNLPVKPSWHSLIELRPSKHDFCFDA